MPEYKELLLQSGALVKGHFVYASGKHGGLYVNKTAGLVLASHAFAFAKGIAENFEKHGIEAVAAPELRAISLMADVRRALWELTGREVAGIVVEKIRDENGMPTGRFAVGRDQERFVRDRRTLVLDDILTTGGSARKAVEAICAAGGVPVAVAALWNRGGVSKNALGVASVFALVSEPLTDWSETDCPFCRDGVPVNVNL